MKSMTCNQLGGACDEIFQAETFEEIGNLSRNHAMKMFQQEDAAHIAAGERMRELMQEPEAMKEWFDSKKKEFDAL